jgi:hypothetical protein
MFRTVLNITKMGWATVWAIFYTNSSGANPTTFEFSAATPALL